MSEIGAESRPSVGIVGLGLIGGSIGLALRTTKRQILGCDTFKDAEHIAVVRQCVDRIASLEDVSQCDVVFVGVPPAFVQEVVHDVFRLKRPSTVVTDCSSVKSGIARWAEELDLTHFVPGHPMAGHEKSGCAFASAWMFKGARWILTPSSVTSHTAIKELEKLIVEMGAVVVNLQAVDHDRHVALLSHLPHVLAGALVMDAEQLDHWEVGAGSWKDLTRVGGVDPGLWTQILHGNKKELGIVVADFERRLADFRKLLDLESPIPLQNWLEVAKVAKTKQGLQQPNTVPAKRKRPT